MTKISSITIAFLLLAITNISFARDIPEIPFRIELKIKGDEKNRIASYLARELRSLQDVLVVSRNPDWVISVLSIKTKTKSGTQLGYALSVVVLSTREELLGSVHFFENQALYIGNDLKDICSDIIADFDIETLQGMRELLREISDQK